ncbi:hypothetical protein [Amycolatopsis tolypomycina]|uniref:hypothetical protein n=1 Tax=Amycolatopsis tolypomycina TaxID=208445 RepID=UPI0033AAA804
MTEPMPMPAVFRCSLRNGRVAYLVIVLGLCTAGLVAAGLAGGVAGRGAGQFLSWLGAVVLVAAPTIAYLRRTKIVVDAEQVRVHTLLGAPGTARREAVARIRTPRSGLGCFADAEGKVLVAFRDAYTREQLAELAGLLGVELVTGG